MRKITLIFVAFISTVMCYAQLETREIMHGDTTRKYLEYIPASYTGNDAFPVVFALHGLGDNMNDFSGTGMHLVADTANIICITPQALVATYMGYEIGTAWNSGASLQGIVPNQDVDDAGFFMAILDSLETHYNIDTEQVYFFGFSMGGYMCNKMACEAGGRINAIASVSGTMGNAYSPVPEHHTACLHIHGTTDETVAYTGNDSGMDADSLVNFWVNHNGNDTSAVFYEYPDSVDDGLSFERYVYPNGTEQVAHIKVIGGAHEWYYIPNNDMDYAQEIWRFFKYRFPEPEQQAISFETSIGCTIFPNPASSCVTIEINEPTISGDINIYNSSGKLMQTISPGPQHIQLNVSAMPVGMYYVCTSTGKLMHKLVVAR